MVSFKLFKKDSDDTSHRGFSERRSGYDRRSGKDRRSSPRATRHERRRRTRDLYKDDLDRHLWSWTTEAEQRRKKRKRKKKRRTVAGIVASTIGAAGLSVVLLRSLREDERPPDPEQAEADLDETDFED